MEDINIPLLQGNLEDIIQEQSVNNSEEQVRDSTANTQEIYDQEARLIINIKQNVFIFFGNHFLLCYTLIELPWTTRHYLIISRI